MPEVPNDLTAAIIALITSTATLLALAAAWVKQKMAVDEIKSDRAATKISRDKDAEDLRDKILKHDFMLAQLKDTQALHSTAVDDLRDSIATLNTNVAKLGVVVETLNETVKELKR